MARAGPLPQPVHPFAWRWKPLNTTTVFQLLSRCVRDCSGSHIACWEAPLKLRTLCRRCGCGGRPQTGVWSRMPPLFWRRQPPGWPLIWLARPALGMKHMRDPGFLSRWTAATLPSSGPNAARPWSSRFVCCWKSSRPAKGQPTFCGRRSTTHTIRFPSFFT